MKVTVPNTNSGYNLSVINAALQTLADELNNKVLYRDNPAGEPNAMSSNLDMNGKRIYNLPTPSLLSEAARLQDIINSSNGNNAANLITFLQAAVGAVTRTVQSKLEDFVSVKDFGAVGDGLNDDTVAIQAAIDASRKVYLPAGTYRTTAELVVNSAGQALIGDGGHLGTTTIVAEHISNSVLRVKQRSFSCEGIRITSNAGRFAAVTSSGHGIFLGGDDTLAGRNVSMSRQYILDVEIRNQPTDGFHTRYGCELSNHELITVVDCKRHGFVYDGGGTSGASNRGVGPFHWINKNCRAFECGGNALVIGSADQSGVEFPIDGYFLNFEALGCAWDSAVRQDDYMVINRGNGMIFEMPDLEDQQYASATTSSTGVARVARATPTKGFLLGGGRPELRNPYFSSLIQSVEITGGVQTPRVINPRIFSGTYGIAQTYAVNIESTVVGFEGLFSTASCPGATQLVRNQSLTARYRLDGEEYLGTTPTPHDVRVVVSGSPTVGTIASGVASEPVATLMQYEAESDTAPADSVSRITRTGFPPGVVLKIVAKAGETITYSDGTANSGTNYGLELGAGTRVVTDVNELWLVFSTRLNRWVETLYVA